MIFILWSSAFINRSCIVRVVRGSNAGVGEIFRTRPDGPWGPHSFLYDGYRVSFSEVKRPGRGVDHPPPSIAQVK